MGCLARAPARLPRLQRLRVRPITHQHAINTPSIPAQTHTCKSVERMDREQRAAD